jgi:hypothetical protein
MVYVDPFDRSSADGVRLGMGCRTGSAIGGQKSTSNLNPGNL